MVTPTGNDLPCFPWPGDMPKSDPHDGNQPAATSSDRLSDRQATRSIANILAQQIRDSPKKQSHTKQVPVPPHLFGHWSVSGRPTANSPTPPTPPPPPVGNVAAAASPHPNDVSGTEATALHMFGQSNGKESVLHKMANNVPILIPKHASEKENDAARQKERASEKSAGEKRNGRKDGGSEKRSEKKSEKSADGAGRFGATAAALAERGISLAIDLNWCREEVERCVRQDRLARRDGCAAGPLIRLAELGNFVSWGRFSPASDVFHWKGLYDGSVPIVWRVPKKYEGLDADQLNYIYSARFSKVAPPRPRAETEDIFDRVHTVAAFRRRYEAELPMLHSLFTPPVASASTSTTEHASGGAAVSTNPGLVLAGGAMSRLLTRTQNAIDWSESDVDLFAVGLSEQGVLDAIERLAADLAAYWSAKYGPQFMRVYVYRTRRCVTFKCEPSHKEPLVQVILTRFASVGQLLASFDLGSACAAYDGTDVFFNARGKLAYEHAINVVDPTIRRWTFESRICKYADRGFAICLPNLRDPSSISLSAHQQRKTGKVRSSAQQKHKMGNVRSAGLEGLEGEAGAPEAGAPEFGPGVVIEMPYMKIHGQIAPNGVICATTIMPNRTPQQTSGYDSAGYGSVPYGSPTLVALNNLRAVLCGARDDAPRPGSKGGRPVPMIRDSLCGYGLYQTTMRFSPDGKTRERFEMQSIRPVVSDDDVPSFLLKLAADSHTARVIDILGQGVGEAFLALAPAARPAAIATILAAVGKSNLLDIPLRIPAFDSKLSPFAQSPVHTSHWYGSKWYAPTSPAQAFTPAVASAAPPTSGALPVASTTAPVSKAANSGPLHSTPSLASAAVKGPLHRDDLDTSGLGPLNDLWPDLSGPLEASHKPMPGEGDANAGQSSQRKWRAERARYSEKHSQSTLPAAEIAQAVSHAAAAAAAAAAPRSDMRRSLPSSDEQRWESDEEDGSEGKDGDECEVETSGNDETDGEEEEEEEEESTGSGSESEDTDLSERDARPARFQHRPPIRTAFGVDLGIGKSGIDGEVTRRTDVVSEVALYQTAGIVAGLGQVWNEVNRVLSLLDAVRRLDQFVESSGVPSAVRNLEQKVANAAVQLDTVRRNAFRIQKDFARLYGALASSLPRPNALFRNRLLAFFSEPAMLNSPWPRPSAPAQENSTPGRHHIQKRAQTQRPTKLGR